MNCVLVDVLQRQEDTPPPEGGDALTDVLAARSEVVDIGEDAPRLLNVETAEALQLPPHRDPRVRGLARHPVDQQQPGLFRSGHVTPASTAAYVRKATGRHA